MAFFLTKQKRKEGVNLRLINGKKRKQRGQPAPARDMAAPV
jgi:hypothetical protein